MPEVQIVNVTKRYGEIIANNHINFTIHNGEYVSVIGPSGCGKTTLIKNIAGIIQPDEGDIIIDGQRINDLPIEERGVGYVFQNIALFPHMNVWDNIVYGPRVRGISPTDIRPLALEMLELIKLRERVDAYPSELSGGSQQKTAVARALTSRSELLLLDEPLGALDMKVRAELRTELRKLVKDLNLTAFHVTHDQEEAMSISDRVIVMKKGRIVEAGAPINLYTKPQNIFTANFVGEANFLVGVVERKTDPGIVVNLGNSLRLQTRNTDHKIGDRVVIAFRPEFINIDTRTRVNRLRGTIIDTIYSGKIRRIRIQLITEDVIVLKIIDEERRHLSLDTDITMSIAPESILVYSYPEDGLETELALE
jgi:putative spermidine/putrescine transport system ATP-binding protein